MEYDLLNIPDQVEKNVVRRNPRDTNWREPYRPPTLISWPWEKKAARAARSCSPTRRPRSTPPSTTD